MRAPSRRTALPRVAMRRHIYLSFVLTCAYPLLCQAADDPARPRAIKVICPAVQLDDRPRTNYFGEITRQPELVVLGTIKKNTDKDDNRIYDTNVEKVLYGSWPNKTLQFTSPFTLGDGRRIIALVRSLYDGGPP